MSVKVVIASGGREVSVETSANASGSTVVAQALEVWNQASAVTEKPVLEAGGMGFQAELAPQPVDEEARRPR